MDMNHHRLLERLVGPPLLITPDKAQQLLGVLANRMGLEGQLVRADTDDEPVRLETLAADALRGERPERRTFALVDGIAIIPVEGVLVNKLGTLDPWCGMTGYDGLQVKIDHAAADPEVRGTLLDIDSPGGEVAGCFDLADRIFAARQAKPIWAVCTEDAYSAAYALASQCDRILVPRTGGVGSVGVVCLHADFSRALDEAGITVTLIHAGAHKVDGNPYEPLPDDVRDEIRGECESIRDLFGNTVARGREQLTIETVLATEARCYMAAEALDIGFADAVASPDAAFEAFTEFLAGNGSGTGATGAATREQRSDTMSLKDRAALKAADKETKQKTATEEAAEAEAEEDPATEPDDAPDDQSEPEAGEDKEKEDGKAAAAPSDRERIAAILNADEAKGRAEMAKTLALETDLTVEAAVKVLATAPKGGSLDAAMAGVGNADLGADAPQGAKDQGWGASVDRVCGKEAARQ